MMRTAGKLAAMFAVYLIGWNRGCRAGTTYVRDSWTRAVKRDANATMDARAPTKR